MCHALFSRRLPAISRWLRVILLSALSIGQTAQAADLAFKNISPDTALTDQLRGASALVAQARSAGVQTLLAAALSDYRTLIQLLYDEGYFAPTVSIRLDGREAANIDLLAQPQRIDRIDIRIDPGRRFTFGTARVRPLPPGAEATLPDGFATGAPASTGVIKAAVTAGVKAWDEAGHPKADLASQDITANALSARLDAVLRIAPGNRLRLGALQLEAEGSRVRPEALRRIAGFETGAIYHPDLVSQAATRLRRTGAFSSVSFRQAERANADGSLDFIATVEDQPRRRFTVGLELSTTEAATLSVGWMHRNLFGGAERLKLDFSIDGIGSSEVGGTFAVRLDQPAALGPDENLFYLAELQQLNEEHYSATQLFGAIGVRRTISETTFVEAALGLNQIDADDAFGDGRDFTYLAGRLRGERDRRDVKNNPTAGYYLNGVATPFVGLRGGASGLQMRLDGRAYQSVGAARRVVLAGRLQIGTVIGPDIDEVSPTLLFYSGGAGTVRGQQFQSLGVPVGGDTAGGRSLVAASAELRGKVNDRLWLVGFYDIGLVAEDSFPGSNDETHAGVGIGLRYDVTGIGPLRLDLAVPANGDNKGLQFYIGIGQAF